MTRRTLFILLAITLTGCSSGVFSPDGPAAARIANLGYMLFGLALAVFIYVIGFLVVALFRNREGDVTTQDPAPRGSMTFIILNAVVMPAVILLIVLGATLVSMRWLTSADEAPDLVIEVTGHLFWWEVRYPEYDIVTANEIHIPTGQRVLFKLRSDDVIHSFWVPELNGKTDMIPGRTNNIWIEADTAKTYDGACTEYCGVQHARMLFLLTAHPPDEFQVWIEQQQQPVRAPVTDAEQRGYTIFQEQCAVCHAIEGTNATGNLGPDLTHLASRQTIGAGILTNNRGNLAGWIMDSQAAKPGNLMPPSQLSGEELQALLAYMEILE